MNVGWVLARYDPGKGNAAARQGQEHGVLAFIICELSGQFFSGVRPVFEAHHGSGI
jgi:hypothetical protein